MFYCYSSNQQKVFNALDSLAISQQMTHGKSYRFLVVAFIEILIFHAPIGMTPRYTSAVTRQ
jgi:hypothetical protein